MILFFFFLFFFFSDCQKAIHVLKYQESSCSHLNGGDVFVTSQCFNEGTNNAQYFSNDTHFWKNHYQQEHTNNVWECNTLTNSVLSPVQIRTSCFFSESLGSNVVVSSSSLGASYAPPLNDNFKGRWKRYYGNNNVDCTSQPFRYELLPKGEECENVGLTGKLYYVSSSSGSDSNNGQSPTSAWKTIQKVRNEATNIQTATQTQPVTILFNNADTWNIGTELTLYIRCRGTSENWITFDGMSWGTGTRARLRRDTVSGSLIVVECNTNPGTAIQNGYVEIRGFDLDCNGMCSYAAILSEDCSFVRMKQNVIHDGRELTSSWNVGIRIHTTDIGDATTSDFVIENNEIYHFGAHGIAFYPSDNDQVENIYVRHNKIYDFGMNYDSDYGGGIQCMSTWNGEISYNHIYNGGGTDDGVGVKFEVRNRVSKNVDIHSNYIYGSTTTGEELRWGIYVDGAEDINVYNNVLDQLLDNCIKWGSPNSATGAIYDNSISNCCTQYSTKNIFISTSAGTSVDPNTNNVNGASNNVTTFRWKDEGNFGRGVCFGGVEKVRMYLDNQCDRSSSSTLTSRECKTTEVNSNSYTFVGCNYENDGGDDDDGGSNVALIIVLSTTFGLCAFFSIILVIFVVVIIVIVLFGVKNKEDQLSEKM